MDFNEKYITGLTKSFDVILKELDKVQGIDKAIRSQLTPEQQEEVDKKIKSDQIMKDVQALSKKFNKINFG